ncbi:MAG: flavodoxin [Lachnospiraceae bacterium]|nr:flavodoxin [Lachnospiraceae bacterium]
MKRKVITGIMMVSLMMLAGCGQSDNAGTINDTNVTDTEITVDIIGTDDDGQTVDSVDTSNSAETVTESAKEENETDSTAGSSDTLVVYFSRTGEQYNVGVIDKGNTAIVAEMIIEHTGADAFEILPQEDYYPYTYKELTDVAKQELNDNARPAYKGDVPDFSQYSTIFIGAPVWWGDWPMIMYTFFENNRDSLVGKTLIPFSTHAGSGLSGFDNKLSAACPKASIGAGLAIAGTDAQNDQNSVKQSVDEWLKELGF